MSIDPGPNFPSRVSAKWYSCGCGKRGYFNRQAARQALRQTRRRLKEEPSSHRLHIYRCPSGNGFFHLGHTYKFGPDLNSRFDPTEPESNAEGQTE